MNFLKIFWFGFVGLMATASTAASVFVVQSEPGMIATKIGDSWDDLPWNKQGEETVTMLFTGDIMLGRYIATLRERNGADFPFTYMPEVIAAVKEQLNLEEGEELDLIVGNLEGPITESTYKNPGTSLIFNFQPEVADLLAKVGFTTLSMANNHVFNQGLQGLDETFTRLAAVGIEGFGHPDTANGQYSTAIYEFQQTRIGFLGLNDTDYDLEESAAIAKIQELDGQVDFLIIGIHWGSEYVTTANSTITAMAHSFVDAGADMIWGHHPHVIQNWELYQGAPIYYSLGNFVFDQYWSAATQEGLVVGLSLQNGPDGIAVTTTEVYVDLVNQGEPKPREQQ
jgi:poly-gamma-glutamate synthesis protein (capsule biosynthesis protein)